MELTYKQLEVTLTSSMRINPDRLGTFRSRIKQLQRLEFPPGVNVGRGAKMAYGAEHLFKLGFAFELIGAGLPAMAATRVVQENWKMFAAAVATDLRNRMRFFLIPNIYARIITRTLHEIQFESMKYPEVQVFVEDQAALANVLERNTSRLANTYIVICVTDFAHRILKFASEIGGVDNAFYDTEIISWLEPSKGNAWIRLEGDYSKADDDKALDVLTSIHGPEAAKKVLGLLRQVDGKRP